MPRTVRSAPYRIWKTLYRTPSTGFVIPVFAFANAGVNLEGISMDSLLNGVGLAVFFKIGRREVRRRILVLWLAVKLGFVQLPQGCNWKNFFSVCMLTGIGFTVSMFIADLSYYNIGIEGSTLLNDAKLGILCGSIVAGVLGWILLAVNLPRQDLGEHNEDLP